MSLTSTNHRPSTDLAARTNEMRLIYEHLRRRNAELNQVWAEARVRRSRIRAQRAQILADLQLRRSAAAGDGRRAAAVMLEAAMTVTGVTLSQLWLDYVAIGGSASPEELAALVLGEGPLDRAEYDRIALALNERLEDAGYHRLVSYWDGSR